MEAISSSNCDKVIKKKSRSNIQKASDTNLSWILPLQTLNRISDLLDLDPIQILLA